MECLGNYEDFLLYIDENVISKALLSMRMAIESQ